MCVLLNCEFALSYSIPDFQVLVPATASNLSVVWGEGAGENISGVANKSPAGDSSLEVPESQGAVPRSSQGVSAIL